MQEAQERESALKNKLYLTLLFLFASILICWGIFYVQASTALNRSSQSLIMQATDRVIDTMENTFLNLEHVAIALSSSAEIKALVYEKNVLAYHNQVGITKKILDSIYRPDGLVDDILVYDTSGRYCRLRGTLGNTAATRVGFSIDFSQVSQHISTSLSGSPYIGYATVISDGDEQIGCIVFLLNSSKLENLFAGYDSAKTLEIGLVSKDTIVASNDSALIGKPIDAIENNVNGFSVRQIGLTPYQVFVADSGSMVRKTLNSFFFATVFTVVLMFIGLWVFYESMQKLFFRPMFSVIQNARQIGADSNTNRLKRTGQEEFDQLVQQINSMISRLDENSHTLFQMQYQMQSAEFEKQQAILISLKKQINAHFTVNTLNVVKRLNETGENEKAGIICDGLSSLLRYANGADEFISCRDELYMLEQYVDIMRIRYPDRFIAEFDTEEELDNVEMPRMLVQPIVENAITHGLLTAQNGKLYISAMFDGEVLVLKVKDNGKGMMPEALHELQRKIQNALGNPWGEKGLEHVALPNIQKRIVSMFGDGHGLFIESIFNEGTTVTITLPVRREQG